MKLSCLRSMGVDVSPNPETASKEITDDRLAELLSKIDKDEVEYEAWQKVEVNEVKKMRIVKVKKSRAKFTEVMKRDNTLFLDHVHRVRQQYKAMADLKQKLPENDALIQMDFSENFVCQLRALCSASPVN